MPGGYGKLIYKKRKKPTFLIVVALILISSYFLFRSLSKEGKKDEISSAKIYEEKKDGSTSSVPYEREKTESEEYSGTGKEKTGLRVEVPGKSIAKDLEKQPDTRFEQAKQHFLKKDYRKALELFREISESNELAFVYIGLCHYWLEEYENAYESFERALGINSKDFMARKFMAFTCYNIDDIENSLLHAEEALKIIKDAELISFRNRLIREKNVMDGGYIDRSKSIFKVVFSREEHSDIKETVLSILKDAYRTVGREMDYYPSKSITVTLYNEKGFFDVTRAPGWAGGLYDGKIRLPIKGAEHEEELLRRVLLHEYTHAVVHSITPRCPLWLNEGLAEYFSNPDGRRIGQVIPLNHLERGFPSRNPRALAIAYIESYSAVSYLVERYRLQSIRELLESLGKGANLRTAFKKVYYITYEKFLETWGKD